MKLKITQHSEHPNVYIVWHGEFTRTIVHQVVEDFEMFKYWFEQQRYYLTSNQFLILDDEWLEMVLAFYQQRDELPI
ncbi:hypothetical protein [Streptococcus marmotae]|uniref:hypothetical protein n=1 Tax=Streptococcus marmotae TaxID=1825069 RepID=UPI00082C9379|nr:hypothetical protein [Streptococcus marmotae]